MIIDDAKKCQAMILTLSLVLLLSSTTAFSPRPMAAFGAPQMLFQPHTTTTVLVASCHQPRSTALASREDQDDIFSLNGSEEPVLMRGSDDEIDGSIFEEIETGRPPEWLVMKELLGINIFTYILGALIVFFLSMNFFIGPGWLGSMIGVPGTGSFEEVSESFPDTIDLSSPEFRL